MHAYRALPLPQQRFLLAATITSTAAKAGKDENEPHKVTTVAGVHATATARVEQHQKQHDVASVATASVCTVCKESVHAMYPLFRFRIAPYITLRFLEKLCYKRIENNLSKYTLAWDI